MNLIFLKKPITYIGLIGIALLLCVVAIVLKVTDPSDPKFDPYQFKFTDYPRSELASILDKLIKPGQDRADVERILMNSGGANMNEVVCGEGSQKIKLINYFIKLPMIYITKSGIFNNVLWDLSNNITLLYDAQNKAEASSSYFGSGFNKSTISNAITNLCGSQLISNPKRNQEK